jgi:hypothetical protein
MVASMIAYSLSGSSARALKRFAQTPFTAQREKRLWGIAPAAEVWRQIAPRHAHAEFPDHRVNEKTIAKIAVAADRTRTAGKQVLDPGELVVPQCMTFHSKASFMKAPHESRFG